MKFLAQTWPHSKWVVNKREARNAIHRARGEEGGGGWPLLLMARGGHVSASLEIMHCFHLPQNQFLYSESWRVILDVNTY